MLSQYLFPLVQKHSLPQIQFNSIDCRSLNIKLLDLIHNKFIFITKLYLDNNLLQSLQGIQQFRNLQVIHFNFNFINQVDEVMKINNPFLVKNIAFIGNQIQKKIDKKFLIKKGFRNLLKVNQIKQIGCFYQNDLIEHNQQIKQIYSIKKYKREVGKIYCTKNQRNFAKIKQTNSFAIIQSDNIETKRQTFPHANLLNSSRRQFHQTMTKNSKQTNSTTIQTNHNNLKQFVNSPSDKAKLYIPQNRQVKPFELHPFQQTHETNQYSYQEQGSYNREKQYADNKNTGRFIGEYSGQKYDKNHKKTNKKSLFENQNQENFISEYKYAVSKGFYFRNLLEKAFNTLKNLNQNQSQISQDERYQRQQKLRWAWVKLRLNDSRKKILQKYRSWGVNQYIDNLSNSQNNQNTEKNISRIS